MDDKAMGIRRSFKVRSQQKALARLRRLEVLERKGRGLSAEAASLRDKLTKGCKELSFEGEADLPALERMRKIATAIMSYEGMAARQEEEDAQARIAA